MREEETFKNNKIGTWTGDGRGARVRLPIMLSHLRHAKQASCLLRTVKKPPKEEDRMTDDFSEPQARFDMFEVLHVFDSFLKSVRTRNEHPSEDVRRYGQVQQSIQDPLERRTR